MSKFWTIRSQRPTVRLPSVTAPQRGTRMRRSADSYESVGGVGQTPVSARALTCRSQASPASAIVPLALSSLSTPVVRVSALCRRSARASSSV